MEFLSGAVDMCDEKRSKTAWRKDHSALKGVDYPYLDDRVQDRGCLSLLHVRCLEIPL